MSSRLTRPEQKNIVSMYMNGSKISEIKTATGRSREAITALLGRCGLLEDKLEEQIHNVAARKWTTQAQRKLGCYIQSYKFDQLDSKTINEWKNKVKEEVINNCEYFRNRILFDTDTSVTDKVSYEKVEIPVQFTNEQVKEIISTMTTEQKACMYFLINQAKESVTKYK